MKVVKAIKAGWPIIPGIFLTCATLYAEKQLEENPSVVYHIPGYPIHIIIVAIAIAYIILYILTAKYTRLR